jgi:hypothetical protein
MSLNNDDIRQLITILQRGLTDANHPENVELADTETPKTKKRKGANPQKKKSSKDGVSSYNKFDAMPEHNMHKDDSKIDQLLIKYPPTQRSRDFEYINVICRVCGRKESVNPVLVHEAPNRYKCNKCAKVPG